MRGRSYTPSPPRGYGRRRRSPGPRGRHDSGDAPTSLLVRNLRHDCRPEDLRRPFGQFGPLKDIYLPRDYHTGQPRGFGFVQYVDPADAAEAKYEMDGQLMQGRELTVVFAEENRKKPGEMRHRERGRGRVYDRRRSPPRYSHSPRYSQSPPPLHGGSQSRRGYYSPWRKHSRSNSPRERRGGKERQSYLRSPVEEHSPPNDGTRNFNGSPVRRRSPYTSRSRSRSRSPGHGHSPVMLRSPGHGHSPVMLRSPNHSRSRSPHLAEYAREPIRDRPRS